MTIMPRLWALEHSDCHVGTVEVLIPFPNLDVVSSAARNEAMATNPVIRRPTTNCAMENEDAIMMVPTIMILDPVKMALRRPRISPMKMVVTAPKKQPSV